MLQPFFSRALISVMGLSATMYCADGDPVKGAAVYNKPGSCVTCHQTTGQGLPGVFPPLAATDWVNGDPTNAIRIVLHGLAGPVAVGKTTFNTAMPGQGGQLSDQDIADVLTYVRSSWGNTAGAINSNAVSSVRNATKTRTAPWSAAELSSAPK